MTSYKLRSFLFVFCASLSTLSAMAQSTAVVGDMDGDGRLSAEDVTLLVNTILGRTPERILHLAEGETPGPGDLTPDPPASGSHEYVDLGLPSGTLWATCNVGAASPEESGDYFAWGETQTKADFSWSTYSLCEGSGSSLVAYCTSTKYGTVDQVLELKTTDDAASALWGSAWCMPTEAQARELISEQYTTIKQVRLNGQDGYMISSVSRDASIFFPAVGYANATKKLEDGVSACCWTKSLANTNSSNAQSFYLNYGKPYVESKMRMMGCTIRPVRAPMTN